MDAGMGTKVLIGLRKDTKVVTHKGTGLGTSIFYKHGYEKRYYITLRIGYPLSSYPPCNIYGNDEYTNIRYYFCQMKKKL